LIRGFLVRDPARSPSITQRLTANCDSRFFVIKMAGVCRGVTSDCRCDREDTGGTTRVIPDGKSGTTAGQAAGACHLLDWVFVTPRSERVGALETGGIRARLDPPPKNLQRETGTR